MEVKVGDYVRTDKGKIAKVSYVVNQKEMQDLRNINRVFFKYRTLCEWKDIKTF